MKKRQFSKMGEKGQSPLILLIVSASIVVMLVAGVLPALINPYSKMPVNQLLSVLEGHGYTVYATPAGDFYVNNLYPNADDTYDIGSDDYRFQDIFISGSLDKERPDGTGGYWHRYRFDAINLAKGASGATFLATDTDTIGGYRLDVNIEYLYFTSHVEHNWDGVSDGVIDIEFEVGIDNSGGADSDVVVFEVEVCHKALGTTTPTVDSHSGTTIVGKSPQWKAYEIHISIDDLGAEDTMAFRLSLDTGNSDVDNVIINHVEFKYPTKHPALEVL